jgi:hypothetical protein
MAKSHGQKKPSDSSGKWSWNASLILQGSRGQSRICWVVCVWLCIVSSPWYPCFHTPELAGIVPHNEAISVGPSPHLAHVGYSQMLSPIFTIFLCNMIPSG